jgi:hypothetical protein
MTAGFIKRTSYNTRGGVHYGGRSTLCGSIQSIPQELRWLRLHLRSERDAFIPPKPFASWILNEESCLWDAPVAMPEDAGTGEPPKRYSVG